MPQSATPKIFPPDTARLPQDLQPHNLDQPLEHSTTRHVQPTTFDALCAQHLRAHPTHVLEILPILIEQLRQKPRISRQNVAWLIVQLGPPLHLLPHPHDDPESFLTQYLTQLYRLYTSDSLQIEQLHIQLEHFTSMERACAQASLLRLCLQGTFLPTAHASQLTMQTLATQEWLLHKRQQYNPYQPPSDTEIQSWIRESLSATIHIALPETEYTPHPLDCKVQLFTLLNLAIPDTWLPQEQVIPYDHLPTTPSGAIPIPAPLPVPEAAPLPDKASAKQDASEAPPQSISMRDTGTFFPPGSVEPTKSRKITRDRSAKAKKRKARVAPKPDAETSISFTPTLDAMESGPHSQPPAPNPAQNESSTTPARSPSKEVTPPSGAAPPPPTHDAMEHEFSAEPPAPAPIPAHTKGLPSASDAIEVHDEEEFAPSEEHDEKEFAPILEERDEEEFAPSEELDETLHEGTAPVLGGIKAPDDDAAPVLGGLETPAQPPPPQASLPPQEPQRTAPIDYKAEAPQAIQRSQARTGMLGWVGRVLGGILLIPVYAALGLLRGTYALGRWLFSPIRWTYDLLRGVLREKAKREDISVFELMLSGNAGKPGAFEFGVAKSWTTMKALQATLGLRCIVFLYACDAFLELFTKYIQGIVRAWKNMRTATRRLQRHFARDQNQRLVEDLARCRIQLARILTISGFYMEEVNHRVMPTTIWQDIDAPTFPVKDLIDCRSHLDQMSRDLNFLTLGSGGFFAKGSFPAFLISLIPNPVDFLTAWKDIFVMLTWMKHSRRHVEQMLAQLLASMRQTIETLEIQANGQQQPIDVLLHEILEFEHALFQRLDTQVESLQELQHTLEQSRCAMRRLMPLLCHPVHAKTPSHWQRHELLHEFYKMRTLGSIHPLYTLELERWLTAEVEREMAHMSVPRSPQEQQRRQEEQQERQLRQRWFQQLQRHGVHL